MKLRIKRSGAVLTGFLIAFAPATRAADEVSGSNSQSVGLVRSIYESRNLGKRPFLNKESVIPSSNGEIPAKSSCTVNSEIIEEEQLLYRPRCFIEIFNKADKENKFGKYFLGYKNGVCRLRVQNNRHAKRIASVQNPDKLKSDTENALNEREATDLHSISLTDAKEFWGEPRKHIYLERTFWTFDVQSITDGEPNIYHFDFEFDSNSMLKAYRIRGIGISNPQWVKVEVTCPNLLFHVKQTIPQHLLNSHILLV